MSQCEYGSCNKKATVEITWDEDGDKISAFVCNTHKNGLKAWCKIHKFRYAIDRNLKDKVVVEPEKVVFT